MHGQNERKSRIRGSMVWSLVSSFANSAGTNKRETAQRSPVSPMADPNGIDWHSGSYEVPTHPELAGPAKDITPELHDTDSKGRAELSPDPGRSLINSPKGKSESPVESMNAESTSSRRSTYAMGSNLNSVQGRRSPTGAGGSVPHVMSWMSYDGDAGPQR